MELPEWFKQLKWGGPTHLAALKLDRQTLPDSPGVYAFIVGRMPLLAGKALYVGQASASLRTRLATYLVDYRNPKQSEGHKGKGFILEARAKNGDHGVYVQWAEYGGNKNDLDSLEASLINFLNPAANDRDDDTRHPLLGERDRLNPQLIR
jgi:hypothetical protein